MIDPRREQRDLIGGQTVSAQGHGWTLVLRALEHGNEPTAGTVSGSNGWTRVAAAQRNIATGQAQAALLLRGSVTAETVLAEYRLDVAPEVNPRLLGSGGSYAQYRED